MVPQWGHSMVTTLRTGFAIAASDSTTFAARKAGRVARASTLEKATMATLERLKQGELTMGATAVRQQTETIEPKVWPLHGSVYHSPNGL